MLFEHLNTASSEEQQILQSDDVDYTVRHGCNIIAPKRAREAAYQQLIGVERACALFVTGKRLNARMQSRRMASMHGPNHGLIEVVHDEDVPVITPNNYKKCRHALILAMKSINQMTDSGGLSVGGLLNGLRRGDVYPRLILAPFNVGVSVDAKCVDESFSWINMLFFVPPPTASNDDIITYYKAVRKYDLLSKLQSRLLVFEHS